MSIGPIGMEERSHSLFKRNRFVFPSKSITKIQTQEKGSNEKDLTPTNHPAELQVRDARFIDDSVLKPDIQKIKGFVQLSSTVHRRLEEYSTREPYLCPYSYAKYFKKKRPVNQELVQEVGSRENGVFSREKRPERIRPTHHEYEEVTPRRRIGACFGGTTLSDGGSRLFLSSDNRDEALMIAADTFLLARRQQTVNFLWLLSKNISFPIHLLPLEGTINAHQIKNLMEDILKENGVDFERLCSIEFSKMDCRGNLNHEEYTPLRNGYGTCAIPKNTSRTKQYLLEITPPDKHDKLLNLLNDPNNYIPVEDTFLEKFWKEILNVSNHGDWSRKGALSCENATLSEKGWQKILGLIVLTTS